MPAERLEPRRAAVIRRRRQIPRATSARPRSPLAKVPSRPDWTFLTNHAHVLLCIAREPEIRMRDVAQLVGITERAVQRIVADLEAGAYLQRIRNGRRNHYQVQADRPLRHPIESHQRVAALIAVVLGEAPKTR